MKKPPAPSPTAAELRQRAEERLRAAPPGPARDEEAQRQLHELQVHQVELELQNEELLQSRAELEASAEKSADLYDFAPVSYLTLDLAGVIHEANLTAATYLGVNRAQLLGRPFPRFLAPESSASFRAFLEKTATSDTRGTCEVTLPTAGGPPRCARLEGLAFADGAGAGRHCRLILHDITEHTRESAEICRLLADSERNRRALLDSIEDLNLTHEALRSSEADMAEAQRIGHFGSWELELIDLDPHHANPLRWSDEVYRIFGLERPDFGATYEAFLAAVHPADRDRVEAAQRRVLAGKDNLNLDHRIVRPDGTVRWVRELAELKRDAAGRTTRLTGTVLDITERKRFEAEIERQHAELQLILDAVPALVFYKDRDGRFVRVNRKLAEAVGLPPEAFVGKTDADLGSPYAAQYRADDLELLSSGKPIRGREEQLHTPSGERWLQTDKVPYAEEAGRVVGVIGLSVDITARKLAEAAVRASESKFRQLAESNILGILFWNAQGQISDANDAFLRMVGYTREDLTSGQIDWRNMTPPEHLPKDERALDEIAATGCCTPFEKEYLHKDGHRVAILVGAAALDGAKDQGICYVVDISPQKQAEAKVRASEASLLEAQRIARLGNWDWNIETNALYWSAQVHELFGIVPSEFGCNYEAFLQGVHPEDRERVHQAVEDAVAGTVAYNIDHRVLWPDGTVRVMHEQGEVTRDSGGRALKMTGTVQDVTERKEAELEISRTNRALKMLSTCNEALVRAENEADLLAAFCQHSREIGGYAMTWVGYAQDDAARSIKPVAAAGDTAGYLGKIQLSWDANVPEGKGPAGQTIRSGEAVVCEDINQAAGFFHWRTEAAASGLRSVICLPLRGGGRTVGLLGLYSAEINHPGADELKLLQELADDLAFGIVNLRSQQERRRMETAVMKVATSVSIGVNKDFFISLATSVAEALDAHGAFVVRLLPGEPARARTVAAVVAGKTIENFEYDLMGTPCEALTESLDCIIPANVASRFPQSLSLATLGAQAYVGRRLVNAAGQQVGLMCVLFDQPLTTTRFITSTLQIFATRAAAEFERIEADTRIREQAALLDKAQDAILVRDLDHRITFWNHGAERLYGWSAAEALGRTAQDLFYPDPTDFLTATKVVLNKGDWVGEIEQKNKAGAHITVEGRWTLVCDERGMPKAVLSINTNITERKRTQELIAHSLREKEILLKEIHHRVKNNLQVISSLLALQTDGVSDSVARGLLMESQHRVRAMAMIHEKLYQSSDLARVDFDEYVNSLTGFLFRSYSNAAGRVALKVSCDQVHLSIDTASPCGLILNELVSNALKHAFPDGRSGELRVELRDEAGCYSLTVADTGIGLPENFDWKQTNSLGLQLVDTLTKQIKGTMKTGGTGGASFRLEFKELIYATRT